MINYNFSPIVLVNKGTKLVYKHMKKAPEYNLTAISQVDFKDNIIYWKCKVKESGWYSEIIITSDDFNDDNRSPRVRITK